MIRCIRCSILAACAVAANAQVADQVRRATISGSGGTAGKCTIEVRVDISAEVDVYGDSGRLRTLAGQPATWTRMECTDALPYNMTDFRFRGIDGRGSVKLAQDPRSNNSMAVIRIDDPRGGADGYTFEISWSGASGGAPTGGFPTGWGAPAQAPAASGTTGVVQRDRGWGSDRSRRISAEDAIDLCRAEVRACGERDYGLQNLVITAAAVESDRSRRDWVSGTFNARGGDSRRGSGYRFQCQVDYSAAQVRAVQFLREDGGALQPGTGSTASGWGSPAASRPAAYDQTKVLRACQDAVVARANRDGYQNVSFASTAIDTNRSGWVSGTISASRGPVTDTFDFGCSMDFRSAQVRNLEWNRR